MWRRDYQSCEEYRFLFALPHGADSPASIKLHFPALKNRSVKSKNVFQSSGMIACGPLCSR